MTDTRKAVRDGDLCDVDWNTIPWYRKNVWATLVLLVFPPLGILNYWTGDIFIHHKGSTYVVRRSPKIILSIVGMGIWAYFLFRR